MTWWLFHRNRLLSEKGAIADLEATVDWLRISQWQANPDFSMCVDFQIVNNGESFGFQMIYPSVFPDAPPMIYTEGRTLISGHQYGPDGELCLEHRPDNWTPSITGADMIISCQRLLAVERPDTGDIVHASSAHIASLGRDMRPAYCRFLVTEKDINALKELPDRDPQPMVLRERLGASTFVAVLCYLGKEDEPIWTGNLLLPKQGHDQKGFVIRIPEVSDIGGVTANNLGQFLEDLGYKEISHSLIESNDWGYLLVGDCEHWMLFSVFGKQEDRKVMCYTTLYVPEEKQRVPDCFASISDQKIGIVGCGSIGSKIAASLCRTGVGNFVLVDDDLFLPDNVIRNELDLGDAGSHKTQALRDRLLKINPNVDIKVHRLRLGGQESAKSMDSVLASLGECDLLIDATADPTAFNMTASVATRREKPMIWVEVFAGGIGGLVARARPKIDPIPLVARAQIEAWCNDQNVEWVRPPDAGRYDGRDGDENPLIADDAEVSIMSAHAARFASDILARPKKSIFPSSVYIIGFSSEWIFNQPFDTRPINLQPAGGWGDDADLWDPDAALQILKEHLPPKRGADATPATD